MAIFDCATERRIDNSYRRPMVRQDGLIAHIAVSNAAWPSYLAGTKAHFYIRKNGTICQEIDTAFQSGAQLDGNPFYLSVETEGGVGNDVNNGWTAAQIAALGRLFAEVRRRHGAPNRLMESSQHGERGLGWHRLGIDGNFPSTGILRGRAARGGGMRFSKSRGKLCPTDARIVQMPLVLAASNGGPVTPTPPPTFKPRLPSDAQLEMLTDLGFNDTVEFQRARSLHPDGDMGPITAETLQREYDMTIKTLEEKIDRLLNDRIHEVVRHELTARPGPGRPDALTTEVGHIKTKLARLDVQEVHFALVDGTQAIAWIGTGTWARVPDADVYARHNGLNDWLGRNGTAAIQSWASITGGDGVVRNPLAFGREVVWGHVPVEAIAEPEVDVEPVAKKG